MSTMESESHDTLNVAYGLMIEGKYSQALPLFLSITDQEPLACLYLGWMYAKGLGVTRDDGHAERWYRAIANTNSPQGQFYLASLLQRSNRPDEAFGWLEKAALAGYLPAIYRLSRSYAYGRGVDLDSLKAHHYRQEAAHRGHVFAQRDLAQEMIKRGNPYGLVKWASAVVRAIRLRLKDLHDERIK